MNALIMILSLMGPMKDLAHKEPVVIAPEQASMEAKPKPIVSIKIIRGMSPKTVFAAYPPSRTGHNVWGSLFAYYEAGSPMCSLHYDECYVVFSKGKLIDTGFIKPEYLAIELE